MLGRKEPDSGVGGTLSFRKAIWERMAEMQIGSPYALAYRMRGTISREALYSYLCEGKELSADRVEAVFNTLGIGLAVLPHHTDLPADVVGRGGPVASDDLSRAAVSDAASVGMAIRDRL